MTLASVRLGDAWYPPLLRELYDPPRLLHLRGGSPELLAAPAVAIVGARSCSTYGAQVARMLGRELAAAGLIVVSGLARGIDGAAHRGALDAGGCTVAVLGCGVDRDYPAVHRELARRITEAGAVVSEYGPGVEPAPWRFPARNRIIAGLALATIVVEARARSGALITADFALELGRDVLAVPGEITSGLAVGSNELLRQGAAPLLTVEDVLAPLGLEAAKPPTPTDLSGAARSVLALLADEAQAADDLAARSGLPSGDLSAALVELELAGLAVSAEGVYRTLTEARVP